MKIELTKAQMEAAHYALDLYTDDSEPGNRHKLNAGKRALVRLKIALGYEVPSWLQEFAPPAPSKEKAPEPCEDCGGRGFIDADSPEGSPSPGNYRTPCPSGCAPRDEEKPHE